MNEHDSTDQELLGLLQELVGQDERVLLSASVATMRKDLLSGPERISVTAPSLSRLERQLLSVHREALGRLFTDACFRILVSDESLGRMVFLNRTKSGEVIAPPEDAEWMERCKALRAAVPDPADLEDPLQVLERLLPGPRGEKPSLRIVAEAGELIAPSEALRVYRARGMELEGRTDEASEILQGVHARPCQHTNKLVAAGVLGRLSFLDKKFHEAIQWYEKSASTSEPYITGVHGWIFSAIQSGDKGSLERAASTLAGYGDFASSTTSSFLERKRADRFAGLWSPADRSSQLSQTNWNHAEQAQKFLELFR